MSEEVLTVSWSDDGSSRSTAHPRSEARATATGYRPHPRDMRALPTPRSPKDRRKHAESLKLALQDAASRADERRAEADIIVTSAEPGLYVQFDSQPGFELLLDSLESRKQGIELVAVT